MNNPFEQPGAFSWGELMTTDPAGAKEFYGKLFGWKMNDRPMEGMTYTVISAGGEEVGGIMETPPTATGMPPRWGTYVTVEDADATAHLALELGGQVLIEPTAIPNVGRFALVQDPQGAVISVISYGPTSNKTTIAA
jgi:uncharacterized protein